MKDILRRERLWKVTESEKRKPKATATAASDNGGHWRGAPAWDWKYQDGGQGLAAVLAWIVRSHGMGLDLSYFFKKLCFGILNRCNRCVAGGVLGGATHPWVRA